ncbi:hypothetical protein KP509_09G033100 [Ceratopteris richardii]|uniref:mannan endo-1,4-beta-mannosidase n=1 Tax=Ceratopteris richardii TaxID=49495 RepID=A0A8T2U1L0_CERRI|nr:hypothetical protein KP509_09G033100 [Ceratopteris richardii]KAH7429153.1 hypothetical protein KP509_09G033100 [Ceratopteris richardii]
MDIKNNGRKPGYPNHLPARKAWRVKMWGGLGSQGAAPILIGVALIFLVITNLNWEFILQPRMSFVQRNGTHFVVDRKTFYVNGWNSYWLMAHGVDFTARSAVKSVFKHGTAMGLSVCRTWAFYDGEDGLQTKAGFYSEDVFRSLDYAIVEARRHGVRLLLSLVNNLPAYGGKGQYVEWARNAGVDIGSSNDSFFSDSTVRQYFKHYLKTIITRVNSFSGVAYRDEPAIFAWELINEPRCQSDSSGDTLEAWIEEMAAYVKLLDKNHLITVGLEGFYGLSTPGKLVENPGDWAKDLGSDFIRHSKTGLIDFASVHVYPDMWLPNLSNVDKKNFTSRWLASHIEDAEVVLRKPVLFTEFGVSEKAQKFNAKQRVEITEILYEKIYEAAKARGAGAGALLWQVSVEGVDRFHDEFTTIPWQEPQLYKTILQQSCRLYNISDYKPIHPICTIH